MKGVALDFTGALPELSLVETQGFAATVQNAMVNVATQQEETALFPTRGTNLLRAASDGRLIDLNAAEHASNFAAADTLAFTKEHTEADDADGLSLVQLAPANFDGQRLEVDAIFTATDGRVLGRKTTI